MRAFQEGLQWGMRGKQARGGETERTCTAGLGAGEDQESRRKPSRKLDGVPVEAGFECHFK